MSKVSFTFDYPDRTLKEILLNKCMKKTAEWLIGRDKQLIVVHGNSHWEAAMTTQFFLDLLNYIDHDREKNLFNTLSEVVHKTTEWLLSDVKNEDGLNHWDGVTWDTAVVLRTILMVKKNREKIEQFCGLGKIDNMEIDEISIKSFVWLYKRFYEWDKNVKYPFGISDVAQILITAIYIKREHSDIFSASYTKIKDEFLKDITLIEDNKDYLLTDVADFIIARGKKYRENDSTIFWEDFFETAEVLEAISLYFDYLNSLEKHSSKLKFSSNKNLENLRKLRDIIHKTLNTLEISQINGMWGTHADTCRSLYSYVKACRLMGMEPQPHIVFKSLRWICDEKQMFEDGSFLHTSFITVFFTHALMEVFKECNLIDKRIIEIYDDVVWYMEASSSVEREKRLQQLSKFHTLDYVLKRKDKTIQILYKLIATLVISVIFLAVSTFLCKINHLKTSHIGIMATVYVGLVSVVWSWEMIK